MNIGAEYIHRLYSEPYQTILDIVTRGGAGLWVIYCSIVIIRAGCLCAEYGTCCIVETFCKKGLEAELERKRAR